VKVIIRGVKGYIKRIIRFKGIKGINDKLLTPLNNQEFNIYNKGLLKP
jgi:hypothetical protein